jgi:hypothetical protein
MSETKTCPRCNVEKPVSEFHRNKSRADGLSFECSVCKKQLNKKYRLAHLEERRNYKREWQKANLDKARASTNRWAETHRDEINARRRERYRARKEALKATLEEGWEATWNEKSDQ